MSDKQALRDLQHRLAERMRAAREQPQQASWLAVEAGGVAFLLSLQQAAEIFTPVPLKAVPYSEPWLAGVANLRGGLFTVVDLAVFLGLRASPVVSNANRLVTLNPELHLNCALQVDRLLGLRGDEALKPDAAPEAGAAKAPEGLPRFAGPVLRDADGRRWQVVNLDALAKTEAFLRIVV